MFVRLMHCALREVCAFTRGFTAILFWTVSNVKSPGKKPLPWDGSVDGYSRFPNGYGFYGWHAVPDTTGSMRNTCACVGSFFAISGTGKYNGKPWDFARIRHRKRGCLFLHALKVPHPCQEDIGEYGTSFSRNRTPGMAGVNAG